MVSHTEAERGRFVGIRELNWLARFSYDLEKWFGKCSLFVLSANG